MSLHMNIPAEEAQEVAESFMELMKYPYTEKIQIAGSLRRKHETVGDIEIVAKATLLRQGTLDELIDALENPTTDYSRYTNYTHQRMQELLKSGLINTNRPSKDGKKAPFGEKYYRINYIYKGKEYPIDFFVATPPADYYVILLIRTGSGEFSHWIVQQNPSIKFKDGHLEKDGKPIYVNSEREIFELLHIPYREPWDRDVV